MDILAAFKRRRKQSSGPPSYPKVPQNVDISRANDRDSCLGSRFRERPCRTGGAEV